MSDIREDVYKALKKELTSLDKPVEDSSGDYRFSCSICGRDSYLGENTNSWICQFRYKSKKKKTFWLKTICPDCQENGTLVSIEPKVGRNEPCPCGSGKKYKKCCFR